VKKTMLALLGMAMVIGSAVVQAAPVAAIDVEDIETSFSNQVTPITAVLTASLGLAILVAVFHWIRRVAK
jgi:uncharacterized membrane protein